MDAACAPALQKVLPVRSRLLLQPDITAKIRLCSWLSLLPRKPIARHQPAKEEMNPPPALLHFASTAKPRMLPAKENLQKKGESGIQKNHSKLIIR